MPLNDRDVSYLLDMLACCEDIRRFIDEVTYERFEQDKMRRLATERQLQVLGEAAGRVSTETQAHLPQIEWRKIIGLRNKLSHDYGEILAKRVWQISRTNVPKLAQELSSIPEVRKVYESPENGN